MSRGRPRYPGLLTPREQEVHSLLRDGLTNEQIARRLGISRDGVKYHVSEILSKLGVSSRQEAALWEGSLERQPHWALAILLAPLERLNAVSGKAGYALLGGAVLALVVLAIGVVIMSQRDEPPQTAALEPSPSPSATPEAPPQTEALPGGLAFDPPAGECGQPFTLTGEGMSPGTDIEVRTFVDLADSVVVASAQVDSAGRLEVTLGPEAFVPDCFPGAGARFFVAGPGQFGRPQVVPLHADYEIRQMGSMRVSPPVIPCLSTASVNLSASGLPPNATVHLSLGAADVLAHNFVPLPDAQTDEVGAFSVGVDLQGPCAGQMAVHGVIDGVQARWKAVFEGTSPNRTPAPAGQGGAGGGYFLGDLNGITFTDQPLSPPSICVAGRVEADATVDELRQSPLDFIPGYLPEGMQVVFDAGSKCQGEVINVVKNYRSRSGGSALIVVAHLLNEPEVMANAYWHQLRAETIAGRPAVIVEPAVVRDSYIIHVVDGDTVWYFSGRDIMGSELLKFVENTLSP